MFCCKTSNKSINKIHNRTLRLISGTKDATFQDLLERDKSRTIHEDNIHVLRVEIYDRLPHDLLIAKLAAYGFDNTAKALITDYLKSRLQR